MMDMDMETQGTMTPIDLEGVTTESLEALQSDEQRRILDAVDHLRRQGLSGIVELPQLVVCGDQSSGKSSVLEAITEIPFPKNENLCTRFATEIILRHHVTSAISIRITPDRSRAESEQRDLREFSRTIKDFTQLPDIISEATKAMGLEEVGQKNKAFARDVLTVEISGPSRPQLALVDLPGLIHSANRMQSEEDVKLIQELVLDYMKNPHAIILAVVTAKNDYANQIVLKHCQAIDPTGHRTLGIITKPDTLVEGSANQKAWLNLAQNGDIHFELGWHMIKNRGDSERTKTILQRNVSEDLFFSIGAYYDIPHRNKGINNLRSRLSTMLLNHLRKELPKLKDELLAKLSVTDMNLKHLGVKRDTSLERRKFLVDISMSISDIIGAAVLGNYDKPFFGSIDLKADVDSIANIRRLRTTIHWLNMNFARTMDAVGMRYTIVRKFRNDESGLTGHTGAPIRLTREKAIASWVRPVISRSRVTELYGSFNPSVVSELFRDQSAPWGDLATKHIENVAAKCKTFVNIVLTEYAPEDIKSRLRSFCVDQALEEALQNAKDELKKIVKSKDCTMTYNHDFTNTVQEQHMSRHQEILTPATKTGQVIEQNMDKYGAEEAMDILGAYYTSEKKLFIDCVAKHVVERHLIQPLQETVVNPRVIVGLTDEQIALLTAEAPEVSRNRDRLEARKEILEKGLKIFKEALGGFA